MSDGAEGQKFLLTLAGRRITDGWDRLSRYCGLPQLDGSSETWAYRYYDLVDTGPGDRPDQIDVLAAAALHPGLSRQDLTFFWDQAEALGDWVGTIPPRTQLPDVGADELRHLEDLASWPGRVSLTLLTKVLHRKRPQLIPLVDRELLDLYRPVTGERSADKAWPSLLRAMRDDAADRANGATLDAMSATLARRTGRTLSRVRIMDIVIWTGGR